MTITESLIAELEREAGTTRRVLERVPEEKLSWKPHVKSMTIGQLALHIAQLPYGITELVDELVREIPNVPRNEAKSRAELLSTLEMSVAHATNRLATWGDAGLFAMWRMTREGRTLMELPRVAVLRSILLNHWYHHRGQLTVYLRLLDVALPPVYGATADEEFAFDAHAGAR